MRVSTMSAANFSISEINRKTALLGDIQAQISSGKHLQRPSDDPVQVAATENIDAAILRLGQYEKNNMMANQKLTQEESILDNVTNMLQRVKELAISSNSDVLSNSDRQAIRAESEQLMKQLMDYGNTQTNDGEFLFAGAKGNTRPFEVVGGEIVYQGDQKQNHLQISDSRKVITNDTGNQIFQSIRNGNGHYSVAANSANTGSAKLNEGSLIDANAFQRNEYTIEFTTPTTFDVINTTTGTTDLPMQTYTAGEAIQFNGIQVNIEGTPKTGDEFFIKPSQNQDIFATVQQFNNALATDTNNPAVQAQFHQSMDSTLGEIDNALSHIQTRRSDLGSRMGYIDNTREENESVDFLLKKTRSEIEDTDYVKAISDLQLEMSTLEAIRKSYSQMGQMSLFNYL